MMDKGRVSGECVSAGIALFVWPPFRVSGRGGAILRGHGAQQRGDQREHREYAEDDVVAAHHGGLVVLRTNQPSSVRMFVPG